MQPRARFRRPVTTAYRSSRHETSEWQVTWQDTNSRSPGHVTTPTPAVGHVAAAAGTSSLSPQRSPGAFPLVHIMVRESNKSEYVIECISMRVDNALNSAMAGVSRELRPPGETRIRSGAGGHVGGEDVVRVAVEVLAGPVIPHRGSRIGVAGGDLDVAQVHARVEHGGDEGVAEHVRVRPGDRHASGLGEAPQAAGGGMAVHPRTAAIDQDGPAHAFADRRVDGPPDRGRQRDQDGLGALAAHAQHPVTVLVTPGLRCRRRSLRRSASPAGRAWPPARSHTGWLSAGPW